MISTFNKVKKVIFCRRSAALLIIIPILMANAVTLSYSANDYDSATRKLNDIKNKKAQNQKAIDEANAKQQTLQNQISFIDRKMVSTQTQIDALSADIKITTQKRLEKEKELQKLGSALEVVTRELQVATKDVNYSQDKLHRRVLNIYRYGKVSSMEVLLNSKSFTDFLNRITYLQMVARQDVILLDKMRKLESEVTAKRDDLESKRQQENAVKAELVTTEQRITAIKNSQESIKEIYKSELSEKNDLLDRVKNDKKKRLEYDRYLDDAENSALAEIQQGGGRQTGGPIGSGKLRMPVQGRRTSNFGYRTHPISGTRRMHQGIDIAASSGTPIAAAASGRVIYASSKGGYGKTVMIDHGNGMTTLYAHSSAILVSVNQSVSAGDIIARVGSTGASTGPHLHFGVIKGGKYVNPDIYL